MGFNESSQGKWTERFGISSSDLIGLPEALAENPDVEALRWCLMNGKISEAEYLEWAMQAFELPAVTGDFFTAPSDTRFWEAVKDLYPWDPGFFPLAEWEGVFLIACLEPPKDFKFPYTHRFVLASARHLLLLWDHLNPPSAIENAEEVPSQPAPLNMRVPVNESGSDTFDMPDGIVMNASFGRAEPEDTMLHTSFSGDDVPVGLAVDTSQVAPRPTVPDGFVAADDATIPPLSHQPDGLVMDVEATAVDHEMAAEESKTMVVPLPVPPPQPARSASAVSEAPPAREDLPVAPRPTGAATPPPPATPVVAPPAPPVVVAPPPAPPVVATPQAPPAPEPAPTIAAPAPPAPVSSSEPAESSGGTVTNFTISSATPRSLSSAPNLSSLGLLALAHLHQQFDTGMILLFDEASQTLKPWKWSDPLSSPANAEMTTIDLNQPSAFRIVFRSKQPFHGKVHTSPVNQAFAKAFTGGKLPDCMTIVPIIEGRKWHGMFLGILNKPKNFRQVLGPFQDLADNLAKQLERLGKADAA